MQNRVICLNEVGLQVESGIINFFQLGTNLEIFRKRGIRSQFLLMTNVVDTLYHF